MLQRLVRLGKKRKVNLPLVLIHVLFLYAVSVTGDRVERLGKALRRKPARWLAAAALSFCLVFHSASVTALADALDASTAPKIQGGGYYATTFTSTLDTFASRVCEHVHNEECDYIEVVESAPCSHQSEDGSYGCASARGSDDENSDNTMSTSGDYICNHRDDCGHVEAVEGEDCTHSCELCIGSVGTCLEGSSSEKSSSVKSPTEEFPTEELPSEELPTEDFPPEELPPEELPSKEPPTEELPPGQNGGITAGCICDTLCTKGSVNPDCPICLAEGVDFTKCVGTE